MVRRSLLCSSVLLPAVAGLLLAGSAAAASATQPTGVNDFDFSSWDSTFEVGVDDDGRATLHAVETRVAEFPEYDQNRGIVAGFPQHYQGASLQTTILSVRDEHGEAVPYETETDDGVLYVLTGDDDYVHGSTTYDIEYEMRDVVLAAQGTQVDEFYWDLLPLDSTQDIASFHAEIRFDETLAPHLTGDASCYQGRQNSTGTCELTSIGDTFEVSALDLSAGEGVTVAIALDPGTVTQPPARLPNAATDVLPYAVGGGAVLVSVGAWFATGAMARSRRRGTGIVVAQYDVPHSMPPVLANALVPRAKNPLTAQIVHLAVNGFLHLEELPEERDKEQRPRLRRLKAKPVEPLDAQALKLVFGSSKNGIVMKMPNNSEAFAGRMKALLALGPAAAAERTLTARERSRAAIALQVVALTAFAVMLALLGWGMFTGRASVAPVLFAAVGCAIILIISSVVSFSKHTVLTREGALQLEYLKGVREFIRVAEADRLRMLQSYTGAERRNDGTVDVIHIYEKLLPYAILFGQEKQWGKVLEDTYLRGQQTPGWVDGSAQSLTVRMVLFSSATARSSTYSAPSTSSSSSSSSFGGSSGGGFSGGGGGGGFSGGR